MKLKEIKSKKDTYLTKYVFKQMELIKKHFNLPKNTHMFYLGYYNWREYLLCKDTVFVISWDADLIDDEVNSETMSFREFYSIKLLKSFPKTPKDVEWTEINDIIDHKLEYYPKYCVNDFLIWLTQPCNLTDNVDIPYYRVIELLNNYKTSDFTYGDYNFYAKRDKDFSCTSNIYAKNLKTNNVVKLYFPYKVVEVEEHVWELMPPDNPRDIVLDDLSGKLNNYQKLKIKRAYLEYLKQYNEDFKSTIHYVLEMLKQAVLPVEIHCGIGTHRIFTGRDENNKPNKFNNVWVNDFPHIKEEPAFFLTDSTYFQLTTKIAFLNLKSATYHTKGIYKQGNYKRNHWELDKEYLKDFVEFLKSPVEDSPYRYPLHKKYVKTNWQHLIYEYNHNTAGWGWDDTDLPPECDTNRLNTIEALPFDLPIPDYTKVNI